MTDERSKDVDCAAAIAALSELQARQRQAHLSGDAGALTARIADDFGWCRMANLAAGP